MPQEKKDSGPGSTLQIIAIGRLHWVKGYSYLILALKKLHKTGIKAKLKILGSGELYEALFWDAKELGLLDWVRFEGALNHAYVLEELKNSDILVHPSLSEGTPNVILEAQYLGLPCIITNWEGAEEMITDNHNGWVVEKRNPEILAEKIKEVLNLSEKEKRTLLKEGRNEVLKRFTSEKQKPAFKALFEQAESNE